MVTVSGQQEHDGGLGTCGSHLDDFLSPALLSWGRVAPNLWELTLGTQFRALPAMVMPGLGTRIGTRCARLWGSIVLANPATFRVRKQGETYPTTHTQQMQCPAQGTHSVTQSATVHTCHVLHSKHTGSRVQKEKHWSCHSAYGRW